MKLPSLDWPAIAWFWAICVWVGSIAHTAFRLLAGDDITIIGAILQLVVASFAGLLGMLIACKYNLSLETAGILCSVAGWSGGRFVQAIEGRVMTKANEGAKQ